MNKLKKARKELGFTQKEVAGWAGMPESTYRDCESGTSAPNVYTALKFADILYTNVAELFPPHD